MAEHTPGPWEVRTGGTYTDGKLMTREYFVTLPRDQDGDDVAIAADILDPVTMAPSEANANLIAAAPDLADACEAMLDFWQNGNRSVPEILNRCTEALAKARGEVPA